MISLPEGWFVTANEVHQNPWDHVYWRYIRIQNGYDPSSIALIYTQEEHKFDHIKASEELTKRIKNDRTDT